MPLPVEVDLRIIAVLRLAGVASGECAEEGVGQQAGYLLLRHSQGVVHPRLEQGNRLKTERDTNLESQLTRTTFEGPKESHKVMWVQCRGSEGKWGQVISIAI